MFGVLNKIFGYKPPGKREKHLFESPLEEMFFNEALKEGIYLTPQVEIGPYRVDLLAPGFIVIEVDGKEFHPRLEAINVENEGRVIMEYQRERYLLRQGCVIFRARGREVYHNAPGLIKELAAVIQERS